jgi:dihydrolipoamide dehydrogenase
MSKFDVVVIGSGPGGYVAAIRAAQLGLTTACVERESLGGICLNWGCIPTKALLRSAEILELVEHAADFGVKAENVGYDFGAIIKRSRGVAQRISKGVSFLFRKNEIVHIQGTARLRGAGKIAVEKDGQGTTTTTEITAGSIILATGARARTLPGIELDGEHIIAYREAMTLAERPERMVVIGAGAIGVEFASFYRSLGTEVTVVEFMDRVVPNEDADISAELAKAFKKRGIECLVGHKVTAANVRDGGVDVTIEPRDGGEEISRRADKLLVAVGVTGNVENIGLEDRGATIDRGFLKVDDDYRTGIANVYAIGDVIGGYALAHVASAEGIYVAELIAGKHPHRVPYESTPACTYCHPEIASVGLTEAQARDKGIEIRVGKYPFGPHGKTLAAGGSSHWPGFAKLIWAADNGELIGAHLIGAAVTDMIAAPTLAKTTEVNAESFIATIWAHPTFAEGLKDAAEDAFGMAIHI